MLHFCTLFDSSYLSRGITLYQSLTKYATKPCKLYVLALDEKVEVFLKFNYKQQNIVVITLRELEAYYPELRTVKDQRNRAEYCFTLSPYLPLYILQNFENINRITSLDADIMFFSDINIIFDTYLSASVLITPHSFSDTNKFMKKLGLYNVSFQSFKNDSIGNSVLEDWRVKCLEWCKDMLDVSTGRFGDQKYLDEWTTKFTNIEPILLKGAGLAPWNIGQYKLTIDVSSDVWIDEQKLIYYHYQNLRVLSPNFIRHGLHHYFTKPNTIIANHIYLPYVKLLYQNGMIKDKITRGGAVIWSIVKNEGYFLLLNRNFYNINIPFMNLLRGLKQSIKNIGNS